MLANEVKSGGECAWRCNCCAAVVTNGTVSLEPLALKDLVPQQTLVYAANNTSFTWFNIAFQTRVARLHSMASSSFTPPFNVARESHHTTPPPFKGEKVKTTHFMRDDTESVPLNG